MSKVHYAISRKLAAECEQRTEWDEPPALYRVHVNLGRVALIPVGVPLSMWELDRPPQVLELLAELMRGRQFRPETEADDAGPLYGMGFRHEGWSVEGPASGADYHRTAVMAGQHNLSRHPARVEIRMMYAVDRAQITYSATMVRGREGPAERLIAYPDGHGEGWGPTVESLLAESMEVRPAGAVVEALDQMVEHLLGVPALTRPSSQAVDPSWS